MENRRLIETIAFGVRFGGISIKPEMIKEMIKGRKDQSSETGESQRDATEADAGEIFLRQQKVKMHREKNLFIEGKLF